jgi:protein SCO1/2
LKLFRKKDLLVYLGGLVFALISVSIFYWILKPQKTLPIFQPSTVNLKLVDSSIQYVSKYHNISAFSLINQNGDTITEKFYNGKIYVADFFFTTCQDICPIMTRNMHVLQEKLKDDDEILLLSHTVMPEVDNVETLKKYSMDYNVNDSKWNLVTGDKEQIYNLARKSYLAAENVEFKKYDLIHTENFVLIDRESQIRGFYDGTKIDEINLLLDDLKILKNSYK